MSHLVPLALSYIMAPFYYYCFFNLFTRAQGLEVLLCLRVNTLRPEILIFPSTDVSFDAF